MHSDISESAKLGIGLIILGVIITTVFTIMQFSRGVTGQGLSMVENSMNSMQLTKFDDYDQKSGLSGTQVRSALKLFDGQDIAILVGTKSLQKMSGVTNADGECHYFNYGALISTSASPMDDITVTSVTPSGKDVKYKAPIVKVKVGANKKESFYSIDLKLKTSGELEFFSDRLWTEVAGKVEFIRTTAKFKSSLIKDNTGDIRGIIFTQL